MTKKMLVLLGNQLFPDDCLASFRGHRIFMAEDIGLCTYFRFHQHKIALFLSAMRHRAQELRQQGFNVIYHHLGEDGLNYEDRLVSVLKRESMRAIDLFEIEDRPFEQRLVTALQRAQITVRWHQSPMFLTSRDDFQKYLQTVKKPFMKTFYERQRRKLGILLDAEGKPQGGRWSFDTENRKRLPKGLDLPAPPFSAPTKLTKEVLNLVGSTFKNHPGHVQEFGLAVSRSEALRWLNNFLAKKLEEFGPYEDAICKDSAFLFHSVLSPALNLGLITPHEVVETTLTAFKKAKNLHRVWVIWTTAPWWWWKAWHAASIRISTSGKPPVRWRNAG